MIGPDLIFATPSLAEDRAEMDRMAQWMQRGQRPGLVVIDSAESAGIAPDDNNTAPWYVQHVNPFKNAGASVLLLDHVPKREFERPRGAIGSTHKMAELSGAGLYLSGSPWTKKVNGKVKLVNHKDRLGDLPAGLMKTVAVLEVEHGEDGLLIWSFNPPDDEAEDDIGDITDKLLEAIASHGQEGVKGSRAVRGLVKAKGRTAIDAALDELIASGMVARRKVGKPYVYYATEIGQDLALDDDSEGEE